MSRNADLGDVVTRVLDARRAVPVSRSLLVAVSGVDGAGKGHAAARLDAALRARGTRTALLGADGWLNLPSVRFSRTRPGEHFYRNAFRFAEMFERLVLPLRDRRSVTLEADFTEETAPTYRRHRYDFEDVDVIVLEGVFLLKRELQSAYDLSVWIDCSFETAVERAIARGQEGLDARATRRAFGTIYFPAERIHARIDDPRGAADVIFRNDVRLERGEAAPALAHRGRRARAPG